MLRRKPLQQYKYLAFLTMLFITIFLICDITAFRMVNFFGNSIPLSGLIIPLVFALGDILAEAYGYRITMQVLCGAVVCQMLFGIILIMALKLPSPVGNAINYHYDYTFQHIIRTNITSCFSVTSGMFANAFLISKLKIYMNGKKFWIRTLISNGFSEIVLCTVAYLILFAGLKNIVDVIKIIYFVWIYKVAISFLINPVVAVIGQLLKIYENTDVYDVGISYYPFSNHLLHETAIKLKDENIKLLRQKHTYRVCNDALILNN